MSALGLGPVLRAANPFTLAVLVLTHIGSVLRIVGLLVVEFVLALADFVRGLGGEFQRAHELKFIPTRVAICIGLRELITAGAQIEALMSDAWLGAALRAGPVVFVGDLNAGEHAHACRRLAHRLTDVQRVAPGGRRLNTSLAAGQPVGSITSSSRPTSSSTTSQWWRRR